MSESLPEKDKEIERHYENNKNVNSNEPSFALNIPPDQSGQWTTLSFPSSWKMYLLLIVIAIAIYLYTTPEIKKVRFANTTTF